MAVYPGAFVDLYTEHLTVISPLRQLRIYCAGVWHNAVLVLVGLLLLWCLPYVLVPAYVTGQGAVVMNILKVSQKETTVNYRLFQKISIPLLWKGFWFGPPTPLEIPV